MFVGHFSGGCNTAIGGQGQSGCKPGRRQNSATGSAAAAASEQVRAALGSGAARAARSRKEWLGSPLQQQSSSSSNKQQTKGPYCMYSLKILK